MEIRKTEAKKVYSKPELTWQGTLKDVTAGNGTR